MFFARNEHKRINPYVAITVGALALVGAVSIMKGAKDMIKCGCQKVKECRDKWCVPKDE